MSYQSEYNASIDTPENFWAEQANQLPWYTPPKNILSKDENGMDRWFADGVMKYLLYGS